MPLARELLAMFSHTHALGAKSLSAEAVDALTGHPWPGNVRELANAIERGVILSGTRQKLARSDLPREIDDAPQPSPALRAHRVLPLVDVERRYVLQVLEHFGGHRAQTARALGIGTNTLWRKLKRWGIAPARDPELDAH